MVETPEESRERLFRRALEQAEKSGEAVGGFTTIEGREVLVTPSGQEIATAAPIRRGGGGGGGVETQEERDLRINIAGEIETQRELEAIRIQRGAKQSLPSEEIERRRLETATKQSIPVKTKQERSTIPQASFQARTREEFIVTEQRRGLVESFESLTPEQLRERSLDPVSGIVGQSTQQGEAFSFINCSYRTSNYCIPPDAHDKYHIYFYS